MQSRFSCLQQLSCTSKYPQACLKPIQILWELKIQPGPVVIICEISQNSPICLIMKALTYVEKLLTHVDDAIMELSFSDTKQVFNTGLQNPYALCHTHCYNLICYMIIIYDNNLYCTVLYSIPLYSNVTLCHVSLLLWSELLLVTVHTGHKHISLSSHWVARVKQKF